MTGFYSDTEIDFKTRRALIIEGFSEREVHKKSQNGVTWVCKFFKRNNEAFLKWKFEWTTKEISGFQGHLIYDIERADEHIIPLNVTTSGEWIEQKMEDIDENEDDYSLYVDYQLKLSPVLPEEALLEESFSNPSMFTDIVLLVEGKKMHTNKMFLVAHSEFFHALFNSQAEDQQLSEISVENVKFHEFARLLNLLLPKPYRPPVKSAESLLILAERFKMPKVTEQVELRLLAGCYMKSVSLLLLSQKYHLDSLQKYMLQKFESRNQLKTLRAAPENEELSPEVKAMLYTRLLKFV